MDDTRPGEAARLAVVTGGGRGIGYAITKALVERGWRCLIAGLDGEDLEKTEAVIGASKGIVRSVVCDVSTEEGRATLTGLAEDEEAPLGLVVNCAARSTPMPVFDQPSEVWVAELETNLVAVAVLSAWGIERMKEFGGGSVINIGSVYGSLGLDSRFYPEDAYPQDGTSGPVRVPAYHASKGGLAALTRDLAVVGGRWNVRVNTVAPGMIKTPERPVAAELIERFRGATPLGRLGRPEDIAAVVAFLACEEASFVTGAEWTVDGGWSIW
ncbi:SDR family oxidoreductase [Saccharomonospora sp. NPDC006951]